MKFQILNSKFTKIKRFALFTLLVSQIISAQSNCNCGVTNTLPATYSFAKGADTGWLAQMEATGYQFYDTNGTQKNCLQLLKDRGINTIRLRVFVNPSSDNTSGHCSPSEVTTMAVRAKNMGFRIMINFHYSDTWAHPGQQAKPAAWANLSFANLKTAVYNHTFDVLKTLKASGVTPEWVQIGNEIGAGLLYPDGDTPNFSQIAQLLNEGYNATKAINPQIKVVVHVQDGSNNTIFRWFFDRLTTNNTLYDVIGMSYYPYYLGTDYTATINSLGNNLNDMVSRYNKEVMVVEVGGQNTAAQNTKDMLTAVMNKVKAVPNNKGLGVIYWEPQGEASWSGYGLSAWQSNGQPTIALDAFLD